MQLDGVIVADAARAQVVDAAHALYRRGYAHDLLLDLYGQRTLGQLAERLAQHVDRYLYDEKAHHGGRDGVQHAPLVAQHYGAADAQSRADGREGVAAVVPSVGYDGLRIDLAADADGEAVANLLGDDGCDRHPEGYHRRRGRFVAAHGAHDAHYAVAQDDDAHREQREADQRRGHRFVLAVTVIVLLVLRAVGELHEEQDGDVGDEVRQRVHRVGHHRGAVPRNAGYELQGDEQGVDYAARQRDAIYFLGANALIHRYGVCSAL